MGVRRCKQQLNHASSVTSRPPSCCPPPHLASAHPHLLHLPRPRPHHHRLCLPHCLATTAKAQIEKRTHQEMASRKTGFSLQGCQSENPDASTPNERSLTFEKDSIMKYEQYNMFASQSIE